MYNDKKFWIFATVCFILFTIMYAINNGIFSFYAILNAIISIVCIIKLIFEIKKNDSNTSKSHRKNKK